MHSICREMARCGGRQNRGHRVVLSRSAKSQVLTLTEQLPIAP